MSPARKIGIQAKLYESTSKPASGYNLYTHLPTVHLHRPYICLFSYIYAYKIQIDL